MLILFHVRTFTCRLVHSLSLFSLTRLFHPILLNPLPSISPSPHPSSPLISPFIPSPSYLSLTSPFIPSPFYLSLTSPFIPSHLTLYLLSLLSLPNLTLHPLSLSHTSYISIPPLLHYSDDHSRVVLSLQDNQPGTDYINASYIDVGLSLFYCH